MNIIFALVFYSCSTLYAATVESVYKDFFDNEIISSNHCGRNIHHFLNFLDDKKIKYHSGYVVSIHEDFGALNLFNARWGSREKYEDGETYLRSNYYFHVFAVIDGKAYDFSKIYKPNLDAYQYITEAYLPQKKTQNVFFQGVLTPEKVKNDFYNLKMKIYSLDGYKQNYTDNIYEGSFIELFKYYEDEKVLFLENSSRDHSSGYDDRIYNSEFDAYTYSYPYALIKGEKRYIVADSMKACRVFGYLGSVPKLTKHEVSDKKLIYGLYASLISKAHFGSEGIRISFKDMETLGAVSNQPLLHYAKSITCTNLENVLARVLK